MADDDAIIELPEGGDGPVEPATPPEPRRPTLVYAALAAGAVVLVLLLIIVWLSSRDDDGGEQPLCLDITVDEAADQILLGSVERIDVLIDSSQPLDGLTAIQLHMDDGECRGLPEGADNRDGLYRILGVAALYNQEGDRRVDVNYLLQDVPVALLRTSTPIPTETPLPTETSVPTETTAPSPTPEESPTPVPTETAPATATSTATPSATATPAASPIPPASPPASPDASPSPIQASPSPDD